MSENTQNHNTTPAFDERANPTGSIWHRWDPHIHMPGTLKNNNFKGENVTQEYIDKLNSCKPPIRAIGITDYYVLDSYEKMLAFYKAGSLPNVKLLFPNIELRFAINAGKGSPINMHLLVCPDDPDHIDKTKRFLRDLKFEFRGEDYGCTRDELVRLGKAFNPNAENDNHALKIGVEQSKISPRNLREAFKAHTWARENILVAIAAGQSDGTGQLQDDGLKALRAELQRMSHIVFSGRPGDKIYWSGKGADSEQDLYSKYDGLKPCIHGSDAHDLETTGNPDQDRYCWIRGDLKFETLRQICFEPDRRVHIGQSKPNGGLPSYTIRNINVDKADWLKTPFMGINSGLVAIIGSRGSGKTALVEMIAAGSGSVDNTHTKRSFLERAKEHLNNTSSTITCGNREATTSSVYVDYLQNESEDPRVRYLSQQFVDQLCSSDGLADELVSAIEQVIFDAHPPETRLGARTFEELRQIKTESVQRRMGKYHEALQITGDELSVQNDLRRNIEALRRKREIENAAIVRLKTDRKKLIPSDNKALFDWLDIVRSSAEAKSAIIAKLEKKELQLSALKNEAEEFLRTDSKIQLGQLKIQYADSGLKDEQWKAFLLTYDGDIDSLLTSQLSSVREQIKVDKGPLEGEAIENLNKPLASPYFPESAVLAGITHSLLLKEQRRLEALIGVDAARRKSYTDLSGKIVRAESQLVERDKEIKNAEASPVKIIELLQRRESTYQSLIQEIEKEATLLTQLYKPLQDRLNLQKGTLGKLSFSVNRSVDIDSWAVAGERLIDKTRSGPFKGVGTLTSIIKQDLEEIWKKGSASEIAKAMSSFRSNYSQGFWDHAFESARKTRETQKQYYDQISLWLYGTDHVEVNYGLEYEGLGIQQLSPGTRGIVLLLLYLSIDINDQRPLIIDQPEENLDPKSIFQELVEQFKAAKMRRQIIIVTHNANLVVNTDADQVIVASRGEHKPNTLPDITYISGGLENPEIRSAVCDILEGGEKAFEERAKRLRINMT